MDRRENLLCCSSASAVVDPLSLGASLLRSLSLLWRDPVAEVMIPVLVRKAVEAELG